LLLDRGPLGTMWLPWLIILSLIGLRHPPTYNDMMELTPVRRFSGQVCILIFFICFTPLPIYF
jgi:hypothetical protein